MAQTNFPISDSTVAMLQSAAALPFRSTNAFDPNDIASQSLARIEQQYNLEHSLMMRCVANMRNAWLAMDGILQSDHPQAVADRICSGVNAGSQSGFHFAPAAVGSSVSHTEAQRTSELNLQIDSLNSRIQDLQGQLAASALSMSPLSLHPTNDGHGAQEAVHLSSPAPSSSRVAIVDPNDTSFLKCTSAVVNGLKRCDTNFLRQVFERHKDSAGSLPASNLVLALTEADAPVIPESEAAAAETIFRFDCDSTGLMKFGEFERAINLSDELALYFQEKRQPLLADALRALVGRGCDQLLRVSQLSLTDMHAASTAVRDSISWQTETLFEELHRSFAAQFEIQAQMTADANKFNVVKMACGGIEDFHEGLTGRVGMPHLKFMDAMRQEHCEKVGCDTSFTTGNYKITTTPKQEWLYIAGDESGQQVACPDMGHGRRIVLISELMKLKLSVDAKLTEVEMLAIVLYTGPMFQVSQQCMKLWAAAVYYINYALGVQLHFAPLSCRQIQIVRRWRQPLCHHYFRARICGAEDFEMYSHPRRHVAVPRVGRADRSPRQVSRGRRAGAQWLFGLGHDEHVQRTRRGSRLQRGEAAAAEGDGYGD
jgi:hypothetical protein